MVSRERFGWFGHVMRSGEDEWISRCRNFECAGGVEGGVKRRGRSVIRI